MAIELISLFETATVTVTLSQDDVAHTWTGLTVVNTGTQPVTIRASLQGNSTTRTFQPGTTIFTFASSWQLTQQVNWKGLTTWGPPEPCNLGVAS